MYLLFYSKGDFTMTNMTNHNLTTIFDNSDVTQAYDAAKEFLVEEGWDEDDIPDDVIWDEVGDEEARAWDDDVKYGLIPFLEGKTVLIIDDMISSGESMLDTCRALKERKAKRVVVCATFGLFTNGLEKFDEFFAKGYLDCVVTTNLNYHTPELLKRDWYVEADMSKFIAAIINSLNHNVSLENALTPTAKIQKLIKRYNEGQM